MKFAESKLYFKEKQGKPNNITHWSKQNEKKVSIKVNFQKILCIT